jgi:hypothetical protein
LVVEKILNIDEELLHFPLPFPKLYFYIIGQSNLSKQFSESVTVKYNKIKKEQSYSIMIEPITTKYLKGTRKCFKETKYYPTSEFLTIS